MVEAEAFGFSAEDVDAHFEAFSVIKDIAAALNRFGQIGGAVTMACVAAFETASEAEDPAAVVHGVDVDGAVAHACDGGDELEGRARRVGEL